ncbi:MAG: GYD domain-containing protein [bacterium]|nr:GYD domain-containing protein [bacterium]
MAIYAILSRFSPQAFTDPSEFKAIADKVSAEIKRRCPAVHWRESYALLGRFDVLDIVESDDLTQLERAAMIIRGFGHSATETLVCTPWDDFIAGLG